MAPTIKNETCIACGCCIDACPQGAIELEKNNAVIDEDTCIDCLACIDMCPVDAITQ